MPLLCAGTFYKSKLFSPILAHQMKITFAAVAECFGSVKNRSLHFKGIIVHHTQILCAVLPSFYHPNQSNFFVLSKPIAKVDALCSIAVAVG